MSEAEIDAVLGWRNEDLIPRLLAITEPNELRRIADRKEATYRAELGTSVPTIPGVETFLATLDRQGILLAVATSAPKANVDHAMARLSFAALFVSVARGDQVVRGKPAPDLCLCALRGIAASAADTILFEDTPAGIEGGKRAGLTVVALTTTHSSSHLGAADLIVEDFRDPRLRDLF